ncbi:MAG: tRNA (adenosine(37)-N6)-threonylcarbamoyltransferase complex ATPase subunit type 1 TsaE [Treponema sp.]|nr:tRNA (adenosine(37)-N6)-threonylcarbamoyltransferase complex ATPase subunit type 1 TsaE [Treponema sp.]
MLPGGSLAEIISSSPEETMALGERIARRLDRGSVVALRGGLGVGKTCLTKGIARGLGIDETITSPTYTIISEYRGRLPLYHIDAYRLEGDEDFENLGGKELLCGGGVSVIEWSERIPQSLPQNTVFIEMVISGGSRRILRISGITL